MQLKIGILHDSIIEKESLEYLRGTLWNFLDIGIFRPFFRKNELKNEKYAKNRPKMTFPLIFVFLCIKQKWPKIQFHLLGHIFIIRFAHFPIEIPNFCLEKFNLIYTLYQVRISDNPRKGVNLRA